VPILQLKVLSSASFEITQFPGPFKVQNATVPILQLKVL
jgi:hypothetical protein